MENINDTIKKVKALSNRELLEEYKYWAGGDDYEGCWTKEGKIEWDVVQAEMEERLIKCGFLERITFYCDDKRHLVCLPYSIENLHTMAQKLNIPKNWFHKGKRNNSHYDIPKTRIAEITAKCNLVPSAVIVDIIRGRIEA